MSSICVEDLIRMLEIFPKDYEVVMDIQSRDRITHDTQNYVAFINGIKPDENYREVRLMN